MKSPWMAGMLAAAVAATLCGCRRREVAPPLPVAVQVMTLRREPIAEETRFSATVRERHRVELSFKVPGTVAALWQVPEPDGKPRDVHEGDVVRCDEKCPLARLDDSDYKRRLSTAQQRLAEVQAKERAALATVTGARATFDRIKVLRAENSVAAQTFDETLAKRDAAVGELDAIRQEVNAATVALQQAEDDFAHCRLLSPIAQAVVSRKYIEGGERVQAGQPIFEIMDLSHVRVAFGVADTKIRQFHIGQTVSVTADAFPGERFAGRITKIGPAADLRTRTFEMEMTIDEPKGLKPGMVVTILVGHAESLVLLPMTAIEHGADGDQYTVYTVVEENGGKVARQRRVKLGGVYDNRIRLVEESPSQVGVGDTIVVTGAFRLSEGQAVQVLDLQQPPLHIGL